MTWQSRGDDHYRVRPGEALGAGFLLALAGGLLLAAVILAAACWKSASTADRLALVVCAMAMVLFALVVGVYTWADLAEVRDRHRYNAERRALLLERLEVALNADLDGNGVIGRPDLPRIIPVHAHGARLLQDDDGNGGGPEDPTLERLQELVDDAAKRGLSRAGLVRRFGREFYDFALSTNPNKPGVLVTLGLVDGRGERAAGRLLHDAEASKVILGRAWRGASMSTSRGDGRGPGI